MENTGLKVGSVFYFLISEMKKIMKSDIKKVPSLRGKSIINLFYEPSTRTRTSFELAGKYLGADVVNITTSSSSVVKGECLRDTILTVQSKTCDAIVMRHPIEGAAAYAAKVADPVIINAGDGAHAHPSQGFLDMFTIREQGKNLKGLKMAIIGDILYSRIITGCHQNSIIGQSPSRLQTKCLLTFT